MQAVAATTPVASASGLSQRTASLNAPVRAHDKRPLGDGRIEQVGRVGPGQAARRIWRGPKGSPTLLSPDGAPCEGAGGPRAVPAERAAAPSRIGAAASSRRAIYRTRAVGVPTRSLSSPARAGARGNRARSALQRGVGSWPPLGLPPAIPIRASFDAPLRLGRSAGALPSRLGQAAKGGGVGAPSPVAGEGAGSACRSPIRSSRSYLDAGPASGPPGPSPAAFHPSQLVGSQEASRGARAGALSSRPSAPGVKSGARSVVAAARVKPEGVPAPSAASQEEILKELDACGVRSPAESLPCFHAWMRRCRARFLGCAARTWPCKRCLAVAPPRRWASSAT